jgi:hypothetical protein
MDRLILLYLLARLSLLPGTALVPRPAMNRLAHRRLAWLAVLRFMAVRFTRFGVSFLPTGLPSSLT